MQKRRDLIRVGQPVPTDVNIQRKAYNLLAIQYQKEQATKAKETSESLTETEVNHEATSEET